MALVSGGAACALLTPAGPDAYDTNDLPAVQAYCVDQINLLRASVGLPALTPSSDVAAFSTEAAGIDGAAHEAHKHFRETTGGHGASTAENEVLWWRLVNYGSVHAIVRNGLVTMWQQGKGGEHYENITGPYTQVGCGIALINGEVTVSTDFR